MYVYVSDNQIATTGMIKLISLRAHMRRAQCACVSIIITLQERVVCFDCVRVYASTGQRYLCNIYDVMCGVFILLHFLLLRNNDNNKYFPAYK